MGPRHMNLNQLKHMVVLAQELNFSRAANSLNMTQSALTRSIQTLEERIGLCLFDRDRGGVRLTSVGRLFLKRAKAILQETEDFNQFLERMAKGDEGTLSFGMGPMPAKALLPGILPSLANHSRGVYYQSFVRNAEDLLKLLLEEEIEFFVAAEGVIQEGAPVRAVPVGSMPIGILVRAGHPLLSGRTPAGEVSYPVVSAGPLGSLVQMPFYRKYVSGGLHLIVEDYGLLVHTTRHSEAICVCSPYSVRQEIEDGHLVEIRPSDDSERMSARLVQYSLERRSLSPTAKNLTEQLMAEMRLLAEVLSEPSVLVRG